MKQQQSRETWHGYQPQMMKMKVPWVFQQLMSRQPQLTLLNHNALAMFYKNNMQAFMTAKFTEPEDYQYLCMLACESQGEEKQWRKEIVEFRNIRQATKTAQKEKHEKTARDKAERLAGLEL